MGARQFDQDGILLNGNLQHVLSLALQAPAHRLNIAHFLSQETPQARIMGLT